MRLLAKFVVLGLCLGCVYCEESLDQFDPSILGILAGVHNVVLNKSDIYAAQNLDAGKYSTISFDYFNNQYLKAPNEHLLYNDSCIDDYVRCTISMSVQTPICSFNDNKDRTEGYKTGITFCEIYLDNCRRGYRVWQVIDQGECRFWYDSLSDDVYHTRKSNYPLIVNLLRVLSSQSSNQVTPTFAPDAFQKDPSTKHKWVKIQGTPIYSTDISGIPNIRRLNHPLVADLLEVLSKQSGNNSISFQKYGSKYFPKTTY